MKLAFSKSFCWKTVSSVHAIQDLTDLAREFWLKGKLSLGREWSGRSVLTKGKRPKFLVASPCFCLFVFVVTRSHVKTLKRFLLLYKKSNFIWNSTELNLLKRDDFTWPHHHRWNYLITVEMCKNFLRNPSKVTYSHQIPIQEKLYLVFGKIPDKHYWEQTIKQLKQYYASVPLRNFA